jgi:polyhydroxybutyrate depolymerase
MKCHPPVFFIPVVLAVLALAGCGAPPEESFGAPREESFLDEEAEVSSQPLNGVPTLTVSSRYVSEGGSVTISWSGMPLTSAWLTLVPDGTPRQGYHGPWFYIESASGSVTLNTRDALAPFSWSQRGVSLGSWLAPGIYRVRAYNNDVYTFLTSVSFQVNAVTPPPCPSPALAPTPAGGGTRGDYDQVVDMTAAGWPGRRFMVHVPPGYTGTTRTPVVLLLHGGGGTTQGVKAQTDMVAKSDSAGFLLVTPEGTDNPASTKQSYAWNAGNGCGYPEDINVNDVGFIRAVLDKLNTLACVDPQRVYATGHSNGARMSQRLGCELSGRIAAIAPNSSQMGDWRDANPASPIYACKPSRPVPVFQLHGQKDGCNLYEGGVGYGCGRVDQSVTGTSARWAARNQCTGSPVQTFANGGARCMTYSGCPVGGDVTLCTIADGGHAWPGSSRPAAYCGELLGVTSSDINATNEIWNFFVNHPLR